MLIRKNSKEFKAVKRIMESLVKKRNRKKLVKLFVVKAGETLEKKIPVSRLGTNAPLYYDLNYYAILQQLKSKVYRMYRSNKHPRLYYFKNIHDPVSDQTPFELANVLMKDFSYVISKAA